MNRQFNIALNLIFPPYKNQAATALLPHMAFLILKSEKSYKMLSTVPNN